MRRAAARFLPLSLTALALQGGCMLMKLDRISSKLSGTDPDTILQSDVGAPPEMESRHSTGIEHQGETLCGGRFTYRGVIEETDAFATEVAERYTSRGWSVERRSVLPRSGDLLFRKGDRQAEVDFSVSPIEPAMSRATVTVRTVAPSATPIGEPAKGGGGGGPA